MTQVQSIGFLSTPQGVQTPTFLVHLKTDCVVVIDRLDVFNSAALLNDASKPSAVSSKALDAL